ncbi:AI-2E family transporter [Bacillus cereus]
MISGRAILYFASIRFAFRKEGVSRIVSIASIYLIVIGLFVFLVLTVIPIIKDQIDALIDNLPYFGHEIERAARRFGKVIYSVKFRRI